MLRGALGGVFSSFLFMEIYMHVVILFGMKQVTKLHLNQNSGRWRWSHFKHHGYTAFDDPHDFVIAIK